MIPLATIGLLLASSAAAPKNPPPKKGAAAPAPATATDIDKASRLFKEGSALYKQGKYNEAIQAFEKAGSERPSPEVPYNIARCWERLGEIPNAVRAYKQYLHLSPDRRNAALVQETISTLAKRLGKEGKTQLIIVVSDPPDATITIDGVDRGLSPVVAPLAPGSHDVIVHSDGFDDQKKTVNLTLAKAIDLDLTLLSAATPAIRAVRPPPKPPPDAPRAEPDRALVPERTSERPSAVVATTASAPRRRTLTWVAGGVAVLGAGSGVAFGLASNAKLAALRGSEHTATDAQALAQVGRTDALAANISFGVAAGAAVAAVVLFFVEGGSGEAR